MKTRILPLVVGLILATASGASWSADPSPIDPLRAATLKLIEALVEQGILTYYYFDPTVCGCLYYGSQQNWDAYRQEIAEKRHIQAEQLLIRDDTPFTGQGGI